MSSEHLSKYIKQCEMEHKQKIDNIKKTYISVTNNFKNKIDEWLDQVDLNNINNINNLEIAWRREYDNIKAYDCIIDSILEFYIYKGYILSMTHTWLSNIETYTEPYTGSRTVKHGYYYVVKLIKKLK